jgi:uncharacterized protein involved in exopolysaccharide biosynthesis
VNHPLEEDLYASHYLSLLRSNWRFVLAMTVIGGLIAAVLILFVLPRQYRAATSVLFDTTNSTGLTLPTNVPGLQSIASKLGVGQPTSTASTMAMAFGTSLTVRLEVINRLGLVQKWQSAGIYDAEDTLRKLTSVDITDKGTMVIYVSASGSPRGILPTQNDDLEQRTLARDIANEYVKVIHEKLTTLVLTQSQRKAKFLEGRVLEARRDLDGARRALKEKQAELGVVVPFSASTLPPEISTLATYERELAMAQADEQSAKEELDQLKSQLSREEQMVLSNVVSQRSGIADRLSGDVAEAAADLAELHDKGYSDEAPECRTLLARIDSLQRAYSDEIDKGLREQSQTMAANPVRSALLQQVATLEGDRVAAGAKASAMNSEAGKMRARLAAMPGAQEQVSALMQEVSVKTAVYEVVTNAFEMAKIDAAQDAPQFTVLDEAIIPPRKLAPSGTKTCGGLAFAGFVIGALFAPAWGRRRRRRQAKATEPEEPPAS